jgi:hypothetical protein
VYAPEPIPYAVDRYTNEAARLYAVMDRRLAESESLADAYSIADIACFPWLRRPERQGQRHEDFPNLKRWFDAIAARPAVQRGVAVLAEHQRTGPISAEARENLFGATGTTSSRAIVFDATGKAHATAQKEFAQHYPNDGWVEHDPEEIWSTTLDVCRQVSAAVDGASIAAIGITNQRETTIVWDRGTGKPVYRAIVWQDRRTAEHCERLRAANHEDLVARKTGLLLDPYFSATKIAWILDNVDGARARAERGDLAFGTVDCFLLWRLTGGQEHATDATNASRTMLFDIHSQSWDEELLDLFRVPRGILPEVRDCAAHFGETQAALLGRTIPVTGIAGDQQAAAVGQACFSPGMIKSTYGTGCFVLVNTGDEAVRSRNRLLTTVCYRLNGKVTYAIEGSIFISSSRLPRPRRWPAALRTTAVCIWYLPSPASERPTGTPTHGAVCSASPATRAWPRSSGPRWSRFATRPGICSRPSPTTSPRISPRCA